MRSALRAWIFVSFAVTAAVPALAFDFIVTEYADDLLTAAPGCTVGHCTLREAVIEANAGVDADRILLSAGVYTMTIGGSGEEAAATGDLDVLNDVEIIGAGAGITILDATGLAESALDANKVGLDFALSKVTVRNSSSIGVFLRAGTHIVEDFESLGNAIGLRTNVGSVVTLRRVSIVSNAGAGLVVSQSSTTIANSTISGNGGAELTATSAVALSCTHCTISDPADSDAEVSLTSSTLTVTNSIVAGNCVLGTGGAISSSGGNVESPANTCSFVTGTDLNGQTVGELDLATLADNGGPTRTHLPGAASVANGNATCAFPTDQRGVARSVACESGAVELTGAAVATPIFADGFLQGDTGAWSPPS